MSYLPVNYPSLCIPRVFPGISQKFIEDMFRQLGILSHVEMKLRTTAKGERYYLVFIHFNMWYQDTYTYATRMRLANGGNIQVYYNEKYYWKVSAYREREQKPPCRPPLPPKCSPPLPPQCPPPSPIESFSPVSPVSPPPVSPPPNSLSSSNAPERDDEEPDLIYENCQIDYGNTPYPHRRRPARYQKAI